MGTSAHSLLLSHPHMISYANISMLPTSALLLGARAGGLLTDLPTPALPCLRACLSSKREGE